MLAINMPHTSLKADGSYKECFNVDTIEETRQSQTVLLGWLRESNPTTNYSLKSNLITF